MPSRDADAPSVDQVVARYQALGERLDELMRVAPQTAGPLRQRYFEIPLAEAMRRPAQRSSIAAAMDRLERQITLAVARHGAPDSDE